jgi:CRISPR-associated protein (TIGR02710 family)
MPDELVLICTVGGSHQPIVTSIQQHRPLCVHFLCSDDRERTKGSYHQVIGSGLVLKSRPDLPAPDLPNIATLAGLTEAQVRIHKLRNIDSLDACYLMAVEVIAQARRERPRARLVIDYTGGTKSMTAGLVAAALDDGQCEMALVAGVRANLQSTQDQTQTARAVHVGDTQIRRRMRVAAELVHHYDYVAAEHVLRDAARRYGGNELVERLNRGIALCRAFDAWDKFQHAEAQRLLEPHQSQFVPWWQAIKVLAELAHASVSKPAPQPEAAQPVRRGGQYGFVQVEDLLLNAERRAQQQRFDDAVGRMYRALELTAQTWLHLKHGLNTSDLDVARLPEPLKSDWERLATPDGKLQIGLWKAWELIAAFPDDPLGHLFAQQRSAIRDFLQMRNLSLFAHGTQPVAQAEYQQKVPGVAAWIRTAIRTASAARKLRVVELPQLPTNFLDEETPTATPLAT